MIALVIFVFYAVEAWTRKTPWIFTDELEWTQISRSIASTGHAARRGDPLYFKSLYAYLIAPAWWIHSTSAAYSAIKYLNAFIMPLAAIPTYLLARMLVTKRAAVAVAVGSVAVPAMAYVTSIVTDVLAYPYFALCSWLSVRALKEGKRRDVIIAAVFLAGGYFIRQRQFTTLPIAFVIAAAGLWFTGPRGKGVRRNWTTSDKLGALALAIGVAMLFNRYALQHIQEWQVPTQYYKNRLVDYGLRAGLSFAIGLGILPVIAGLVSLRLPERRGDPTYRAYAAWTAAAIGVLAVYAADKATSLSLNFATLWEERDLIYLSPLLLLGTAMVFQAKRLDWRVVAGATAFVLVMVGLKTIQLQFPYYEAPGSSIPAALANYRHWTAHSVRIGLFGILALSLGLIALRRRRWVGPLTAVLLLGWMLAGEISMTVGLDNGRRPVPQEPAGPAELGRRARARAARDLRRPGDPRPVRRAADRVLEPLDQARHEPRRDRARAGPDVDPEPRQPRGAPVRRLGKPLCPRRHGCRPRRPRREETGSDDALLHRRQALASARRRPAAVLGHLVPQLVRLHLLQAESEGNAPDLDRPRGLQRQLPRRARRRSPWARSASTSTTRRGSSTSTPRSTIW